MADDLANYSVWFVLDERPSIFPEVDCTFKPLALD